MLPGLIILIFLKSLLMAAKSEHNKMTTDTYAKDTNNKFKGNRYGHVLLTKN